MVSVGVIGQLPEPRRRTGATERTVRNQIAVVECTANSQGQSCNDLATLLISNIVLVMAAGLVVLKRRVERRLFGGEIDQADGEIPPAGANGVYAAQTCKDMSRTAVGIR